MAAFLLWTWMWSTGGHQTSPPPEPAKVEVEPRDPFMPPTGHRRRRRRPVRFNPGVPNMPCVSGPHRGDFEPLFKAVRPRMRACYEHGRQREPDLAGRVRWRIFFELDGHVERVEVEESSLADVNVVECVTNVLHDLRLLIPTKGRHYEVRYPVVFRPLPPGKELPREAPYLTLREL